MMRGMFSAISGLKQHQTMLDVTANDIANVNTIGYKSARDDVPGFADPDPARRRRRDARAPAAPTPPRSASACLGSIDNLMTGGAIQTTGNPLDVAIQGDGFFRIGTGQPDRPTQPIAPSLHPRRQLLRLQRRAS